MRLEVKGGGGDRSGGGRVLEEAGFRGSSGFGAEVRNGLGRPTTSDISASSPRFGSSRPACAVRLRSRRGPRPAFVSDGAAFGFLRLGSSISARAGRPSVTSGNVRGSWQGTVSPPSLSGAGIISPKMKREGNTADFCPLESRGAGDCRDWRRRTPSQQWGDKQNQPVLPQRRFRKFRSRRYQAHLAVQGEGCLQVRETDSSWAGQGQGPALGSAQAAERTAGSAVAWILGLLPSWPKAG